jgi:hypothetical protein
LIVISLAAFVLFIVNIRRQGWVLPVIGVGLWAFISVVVGAVYPFSFSNSMFNLLKMLSRVPISNATSRPPGPPTSSRTCPRLVSTAWLG